jgi:hypothetical protein
MGMPPSMKLCNGPLCGLVALLTAERTSYSGSYGSSVDRSAKIHKLQFDPTATGPYAAAVRLNAIGRHWLKPAR